MRTLKSYKIENDDLSDHLASVRAARQVHAL